MVLVHVRQEHIDSGHKASCGGCPIALALIEVVKPVWRVEVNANDVTFYNRDTDDFVELLLSPEAEQFVEDFDRDKPVVPFSFELDIQDLLK